MILKTASVAQRRIFTYDSFLSSICGRSEPKSNIQLLCPRNLYLSALSVVGTEELVRPGQKPLEACGVHHVQEIEAHGDPPTACERKSATEPKVQIMRRRQHELTVVARGP